MSVPGPERVSVDRGGPKLINVLPQASKQPGSARAERRLPQPPDSSPRRVEVAHDEVEEREPRAREDEQTHEAPADHAATGAHPV